MPRDLAQPAFVLVRPQMGENIGAAARAMWNFGLDRMRVVAPRDGWPSGPAVAMASGAGRLLDEARLSDDLDGAIADCTYALATTARQRDLTKPVLGPEEAMRLVAEKIGAGERVAVLFGPERAGLENADIACANAIINVPVNPAFPSLNLAQSVLVLGYEWARATGLAGSGAQRQEGAGVSGPAFAAQNEVAALSAHYEERLEEAGFFFPAHKAESMKLNLRNMWSRMPLTGADVKMLHGMMRQMVRWKERG